jgi:hypothetical protein
MHAGYWLESGKERDHSENQAIECVDNIKWILERWDGMGWIGV